MNQASPANQESVSAPTWTEETSQKSWKVGALVLFAVLAFADAYSVFLAKMIWLGIWLGLSSTPVIRRVPLAMICYAFVISSSIAPSPGGVPRHTASGLVVAGLSFLIASVLRALGFAFQRDSAGKARTAGQFTVASLLAWMVLVAGVLSIYRYIARHPDAAIAAQWSWVWQVAVLVPLALASLLSNGLTLSILGTASSRLRMVLALGMVLLAIAVLPFDAWFTQAGLLDVRWWLHEWSDRLIVLAILAVIALIALGVRWWGYRLVRHPRHRSKLPPATEKA